MAEEFKPITTQEEFDAAISGRLNRQKETLAAQWNTEREKLAGKVTEYEKQIGTLNQSIEDSAQKYADQGKTLAQLQAQVKGYETASLKARIAHETGLPFELASRLSGEKEDDIRADAQALAKLVTKPAAPPLAYTDREEKDPTRAGLIDALHNMNLKGD